MSGDGSVSRDMVAVVENETSVKRRLNIGNKHLPVSLPQQVSARMVDCLKRINLSLAKQQAGIASRLLLLIALVGIHNVRRSPSKSVVRRLSDLPSWNLRHDLGLLL